MSQHPNYVEVKFTLEHLKANNFIPIGYTDDEDGLITTTDIDTIADYICNLDDCWVTVKHPDAEEIDLYLVLGNEPGVLVNDYTVPRNKEVEKLLEKVLDEITETFQ